MAANFTIIPVTQIRLQAEIKDNNGNLVDPIGLKFCVRQPNGTSTWYVYGTDSELMKLSTGIYYFDYTVNNPGTYSYKFQSYGDIITASENSFTASFNKIVNPS